MKKIFKRSFTKRKQCFLILTLIFLLMLILNLLTPLLADDYSYSFGLDGRIHNFWDIILKQVNHYFTWGGRSVAHTIGQTFLLFPKWVFSLFNSFVYTTLVFLIYLHTSNKSSEPFALIIIHLLLWFTLPVFGQTCLWLIGSCNYLWTMVIILLFLLPLNKKIDMDDSLFMIIGMFILGVLAGWSNENTSFGLLVVSFILVIYHKKNLKNEKLKIWNLSALIGVLIGFILMIIAPGNFVRNDEFVDNTFIVFKILKRAISASSGIITYLLPLFIIFVIFMSIVIYHKKKVNYKSIVFVLGAFFAVYSMCLSPTFPLRAWFGVIVFFIMSIMVLYSDVINYHKIYSFIVCDIVIIFTFIFCGQYINTVFSINELRYVWNFRVTYIEKQKKKNKLDVEVGGYFTDNTHNPAYDLADITSDCDGWPNTSIAGYYGLKSIRRNN